jgi:hypothetical protein
VLPLAPVMMVSPALNSPRPEHARRRAETDIANHELEFAGFGRVRPSGNARRQAARQSNQYFDIKEILAISFLPVVCYQRKSRRKFSATSPRLNVYSGIFDSFFV